MMQSSVFCSEYKDQCREFELLRCCARTDIDGKTDERIRTLLQEEIDWASLIHKASAHGVLPLLFQSLNATDPEAVPTDILIQLRNYFHANALHNQCLTRELVQLLDLFATHDLPVIPIKGPVLAASAYGNLALRQFSDLDILVRDRDVPKVTEMLVERGYQLPSQLTGDGDRPYLQCGQFMESAPYQGSYNLLHNEKEIVVELHWSLTKKNFFFPLQFSNLWERIEFVPLLGTTVPNLSPEDALLFLCAHGSKHCWERFGWICDLAELLRVNPGIDWERAIGQSRALGSDRMLGQGLLLAHDLLGTPLPDVVWPLLADTTVRSLSAQVCQSLDDKPLTELDKHLFILKARERWSHRLRYLLGITMTPTSEEWELLRLPQFLYFLYYPLRPIRLIGKYGWKLLGRFPI